MQILSRSTLQEYWKQHPQAEGSLRTWYAMVLEARWTNTADVKRQFPSADPVGDKRIVFNIKGNDFRLVARVVYDPHYRVMVKWFGRTPNTTASTRKRSADDREERVTTMEIKPIRSEVDYKAALVDIEQYFDSEPAFGTPEADRFDVLAALIGAYEDEHYAIEAPDTVTAIAEVMALRGYKQVDLGRLLGSRSRASEIMNRKRLPTIEQARKLHEEWGVPAASLLATAKTPQTPRRVESISQGRRGQDAALKQQIEEIRRTAYDDGYAAAMLAISEFAARPTATATAAPRRQRRGQAKPAPRQIRGDNARRIAEAMMTLPDHTGPAAAIKKALAEKGPDIAYTSIRHGLGQLQARGEVTVAKDGRTWSYTARHQ